MVGNYTTSQYKKIQNAPRSQIAKEFYDLEDRYCDDKWGPACVIVIRNENTLKKIKKVTGLNFSKLEKRKKPYIVNQCDEWKMEKEFATLNEAKKYVRSKKGESFCQHPSITKTTHYVSIFPKTKEVNQKYMRAIFFGAAPS